MSALLTVRYWFCTFLPFITLSHFLTFLFSLDTSSYFNPPHFCFGLHDYASHPGFVALRCCTTCSRLAICSCEMNILECVFLSLVAVSEVHSSMGRAVQMFCSGDWDPKRVPQGTECLDTLLADAPSHLPSRPQRCFTGENDTLFLGAVLSFFTWCDNKLTSKSERSSVRSNLLVFFLVG